MSGARDKRLPDSCALCLNIGRASPCFFCRLNVCPDHCRIMRKRIGQNRKVRVCDVCQHDHADEISDA